MQTFSLSDKQVAEFQTWNKEHLKTKHSGREPYCGAIGGRITFSFTDTSIMTFVSVTCGLCNEDHDLSDWRD